MISLEKQHYYIALFKYFFGKIQPILAHNIIEKTLQQAYQIIVSEGYLVTILYNVIQMLLQA